MSETKLTGAACRWCGSDDDECLYTQCHDLPDGEEHAPCGAYFPSEDNVSDAGIGRAALSLAQARIRELEKRVDHYGVALMMIRAGCSDPARFAGNILDDKQPIDIDIEDELP